MKIQNLLSLLEYIDRLIIKFVFRPFFRLTKRVFHLDNFDFTLIYIILNIALMIILMVFGIIDNFGDRVVISISVIPMWIVIFVTVKNELIKYKKDPESNIFASVGWLVRTPLLIICLTEFIVGKLLIEPSDWFKIYGIPLLILNIALLIFIVGCPSEEKP